MNKKSLLISAIHLACSSICIASSNIASQASQLDTNAANKWIISDEKIALEKAEENIADPYQIYNPESSS